MYITIKTWKGQNAPGSVGAMGEVERFSGFVRSTFVRVRLEENDRLRLLVDRQAQIPRVTLGASRCWATCGSGGGFGTSCLGECRAASLVYCSLLRAFRSQAVPSLNIK